MDLSIYSDDYVKDVFDDALEDINPEIFNLNWV